MPALPAAGGFTLVFAEPDDGGWAGGAQDAGPAPAAMSPADMSPADVYLVRPGAPCPPIDPVAGGYWVVAFHADALATTRGDVYALLADEVSLAAFAGGATAARTRFEVAAADRPRWRSWLALLEGEACSHDLGAREAARALLELLLVDVARLAQALPGPGQPATRPILVRVFRVIEQRFRTPIGLADVAKAVARSPSYLTDLVRRETGRTVLQWIIERRMAEARRLLLETDVRVKDIGPRIGYDDTGHFIRQFHRLHGEAPQHWRQARGGGPAAHAAPARRQIAHAAERSSIATQGGRLAPCTVAVGAPSAPLAAGLCGVPRGP